MKKPVAFITGIAGFAGSYLAEELLNHNYYVTGALYPVNQRQILTESKKN